MAAIRAAIIQMRSGVDPANNVESLRALVRQAADAGAIYVQTPEMTGAVPESRESLRAILKDEAGDAVVREAAALAAAHGIHLHIGSTAILLDDGRIANRGFLFGPNGALLVRYDKIHMFDVDLDNGESWRESATYHPGECAQVIDLPFGRLGIGICYDIRFPHLFRDQALAGAQILTAPAAFTRQTGSAHWHVLQRARAIENGAYVISAAQGGRHEGGRETYGHSLIVDPWGRVVAEIDNDEPGVAVAEIDLAEVASARAKIPNLKNARAYRLETIGAEPVQRRGA